MPAMEFPLGFSKLQGQKPAHFSTVVTCPSPWTPWGHLPNKILVENWLLRVGMGMGVAVGLWESGGGNGRGDGSGKPDQTDSGKAA